MLFNFVKFEKYSIAKLYNSNVLQGFRKNTSVYSWFCIKLIEVNLHMRERT